MQSMEFLLLSYLFNSLWQVPFIGIAAMVAARAARSISPLAEHCVWVGALLLQAFFPHAPFCRPNGSKRFDFFSSVPIKLRYPQCKAPQPSPAHCTSPTGCQPLSLLSIYS